MLKAFTSILRQHLYASIFQPSSVVMDSARILVDPASCHMLVSKIKPCMSKYTLYAQ